MNKKLIAAVVAALTLGFIPVLVPTPASALTDCSTAPAGARGLCELGCKLHPEGCVAAPAAAQPAAPNPPAQIPAYCPYGACQDALPPNPNVQQSAPQPAQASDNAPIFVQDDPTPRSQSFLQQVVTGVGSVVDYLCGGCTTIPEGGQFAPPHQ